MPPTIQLWEFVGLGLIIEYPSGVAYSNQTGGTSCLHPSLEGIFVPLRNEGDAHELMSPQSALYDYFEGPKWRGSGATEGVDSEDADFIDRLLSEYRLSHCIAVDRARLSDSHEAWIHVTITGNEAFKEEAAIYSGFGPYPQRGILTWLNTD